MHRFFLPAGQCQSSALKLEDQEAHHGLHVLRLRCGDQVTVLDGVGHEMLCKVREFDRHSVQLDVTEKHFIPPLPWQITLLQAIPKGKTFETIIQKATELGVTRIVPLLTERVVTHIGGESKDGKAEKWRQIAIEAIKQCGSTWLPKIDLPVSLAGYLDRREKFELPLVASLQPDRSHPRDRFRQFHADHGRAPQSVCIWVGPEGDFSPSEMDAIRSWGALPVSLGRLVLRSDTAAIYCLSVLGYELQAEHR